jgi:hypothetical protein
MRRVLVFAICVVVAVTGLSVILRSASPTPVPSQHFLKITLSMIPVSNGLPNRCSILVSNISASPVEYCGPASSPLFHVFYFANDTWHDYWTISYGRGLETIPACGYIKTTLDIPQGATALKLGLDITSFTWRGATGWRLIGKGPAIVNTLAGFLVRQDEKVRKVTEWSAECRVDY